MAKTDVTRRGFMKASLATGALAVAAGLAGCASSPGKQPGAASDGNTTAQAESSGVPNIEPVEAPATWDMEADVIVVGCGAAGLNACAKATERGAKVILVEKGNNFGGSAKYSTVAAAYGSKCQLESCGFDLNDPATWDEWFNRLWAHQNYTTMERLEKALIRKSGEMIDWMGDSLGIEWQDRHTTDERLEAFRYHMKKEPPEFRHVGIMGFVTDALVEKVTDMGATISPLTEMTALVQQDGKVVGIQAKKDGSTIHIKGSSVVLCAGGMANNLDMLAQYVPTALERCGSTWDMYGTGEVIRMGWGAGADIAGYDSFDCFDGGIPYYERGTGPWYHFLYSGDTALARNPWLFVNDYAEQFCMLFPGDQSFWRPRIIQSQPNHHAYVIFDDRFQDTIWTFGESGCRQPVRPDDPGIDYFKSVAPATDWMETVNASIESGDILKADTIEELAEKAGLDPAKLKKTVDDYNTCCEKGVDDLFGRNPDHLVSVTQAPFYLIEVKCTLAATDCGLRVNEYMQVLDKGGNPIPGLFAAGHTAGGFSGEETYAHASTLTNCGLGFTTGYIAGENVEF